MAISPITIATQGVLNSPLSVAAVRGHLSIAVEEAIQRGSGTSTGPLILPQEKLRRQLRREDDEILTILLAATEVIDE